MGLTNTRATSEMNHYGVPAVFRSMRRQKLEDLPWQARQWLLHKHGSVKFLKGVLRECPGVEPDCSKGDLAVILAVLVMFGVCIALGLL